MRKSCPLCRGAVERQTLGPLSAEDPPLRLMVEGMPAARCVKNHPSPVDNDSTKEAHKHTAQAVAVLNDAAKFPHSG